MKISFLNRNLSFIMAFVVLFSTFSFTVESHYCGNHLVDTAIFTKAKACSGYTIAQSPIKKGCCKSEVDVVKGQDQLKLNNFDDLEFNQQILFSNYGYSSPILFKLLAKQNIPNLEYIPPNLIYDLQILDETFLI